MGGGGGGCGWKSAEGVEGREHKPADPTPKKGTEDSRVKFSCPIRMPSKLLDSTQGI